MGWPVVVAIIVVVVLLILIWRRYYRAEPIQLEISPAVVRTTKIQNRILEARVVVAPHTAVVWTGTIPQDLPYWGLEYETATPHDTLSSKDIETPAIGDQVAIVATAHHNLYRAVEAHLQQQWLKARRRRFLHVYPLYVPDGASQPLTAVLRLVRRQEDQTYPTFTAEVFQSPTLKHYTPAPSRTLRQTSTAPREVDRLSTAAWSRVAHNAVEEKGYQPIREVVTQEMSASRDITTFTADLVVAEDEEVLAVALDHTRTSRATYCTLSFSLDGKVEAVHTLGDSYHQLSRRGTAMTAHLLTYRPPRAGRVKVIEELYTEPFSRIGPAHTSILPMRVLVSKTAYS